MNTWIYKMVAWHRRFAVAAAGLKSGRRRDSDRIYWNRTSRRWRVVRQESYILVTRRGGTPEFTSRSRW